MSRRQADTEALVGEVRELALGFSADRETRRQGSSGGVGTEIARFVLDTGLADAVIGVGFADKDPTAAAYRIVRRTDEVAMLAGSKYVYMRWEPLREMVERHAGERLLVFSQPCWIPSLRRLQQGGARIAYLVSPFCGYNMTEEGTDYLLHRAGLARGDVLRLAYRDGAYPGGFTAVSKDGRCARFGKECYELVDLMFLRKGCSVCRLYMGEGADLALGDAWTRGLPDASVVLARTEAGRDLLSDVREAGRVRLFELSPDDLVRMHRANLRFKKRGLPAGLRLLHRVLSTRAARRWAPFRAACFLSRIRRRFAVGVALPQPLREKIVAAPSNGEPGDRA